MKFTISHLLFQLQNETSIPQPKILFIWFGNLMFSVVSKLEGSKRIATSTQAPGPGQFNLPSALKKVFKDC